MGLPLRADGKKRPSSALARWRHLAAAGRPNRAVTRPLGGPSNGLERSKSVGSIN